MDDQFEFKMVGKDEAGNPLYQKVAKQATSSSANQTPTTGHVIETKNKSKSQSIKNGANDFLYRNIEDELIELNHKQSKQKYNDIQFRDKEFVLKVIKRHPIGLAVIWVITTVIIVLMGIIWSLVFFSPDSIFANMEPHQLSIVTNMSSIIFASIVAISLVFGYISTMIYRANRMIVTTEKLIQYMSNGLFDVKKQTIDLGWIEDVSYHKTGIAATIFDYGSIRMSTIGDESTYYLKFTLNPEQTTSQLNELILAVKNEDPLPNIND